MKDKHVSGLATLCYLIADDKILLGRKKYGKAKGILNGFGGKVEHTDKDVTAAVVREFEEETGIVLDEVDINSILYIHREKENGQFNIEAKIYIYLASKWNGNPTESDEMSIEWHDSTSLPLDEMWAGDKLWFNISIGNRKSKISLFFKPNQDSPHRMLVEFVDKIDATYK